jgi:hypothetical protein
MFGVLMGEREELESRWQRSLIAGDAAAILATFRELGHGLGVTA